MNKYLLACIVLALEASPALAQSEAGAQPYGDAVRTGAVTSGGSRSDQGPGGVTARDIVGKRLLDGDGNPIGHIEKLSTDGRSAVVRPPHGGPPILVDMSSLSLGMGANTVIDEGKSLAQERARQAMAAARLREGTRSSSTVTTQDSGPLPATIVTRSTATERSTIAP